MPWLSCLLVAIGLSGLCGLAFGRQVIDIYDAGSLAQWDELASRELRSTVRNKIWPVLMDDEQRSLADVELDFPSLGPTEYEPFFFSAYRDALGRPKVAISLFTLRFFKDLCVAQAWLQLSGKAIDTPALYVSILRRELDSGQNTGRLRAPLEALEIPDFARDTPPVAKLAATLYYDTLKFLLVHEMGHHRFRHPYQSLNLPMFKVRSNHLEADRFAVSVSARMGNAPVGLGLFYLYFANWIPTGTDFSSDEGQRTSAKVSPHLVNPERMFALAAEFRARASQFARDSHAKIGADKIEKIASELEKVGRLLEDNSRNRGLQAATPALRWESLKPRPANQAIDTISAAPGKTAALGPFSGRFTGSVTDESGTLPVNLELQREGDSVSGTYQMGGGTGTIQGTVEGDQLRFRWTRASNNGGGVLNLMSDGSLKGFWGYGQSTKNGGVWSVNPE